MTAGILFSNDSIFLKLVWANPSDSYGNDINYIEIWQWNGTAYLLKGNLTESGGNVRVNDNQTLKFLVNIRFNDTLASDNDEAISYTKVYMNITDIWANEELTNIACEGSGGFYWLTEQAIWNQTDYPLAGVTYECAVSYQAYY